MSHGPPSTGDYQGTKGTYWDYTEVYRVQGFRVSRKQGKIWALYRDTGKEHGNYYIIIGHVLGL